MQDTRKRRIFPLSASLRFRWLRRGNGWLVRRHRDGLRVKRKRPKKKKEEKLCPQKVLIFNEALVRGGNDTELGEIHQHTKLRIKQKGGAEPCSGGGRERISPVTQIDAAERHHDTRNIDDRCALAYHPDTKAPAALQYISFLFFWYIIDPLFLYKERVGCSTAAETISSRALINKKMIFFFIFLFSTSFFFLLRVSLAVWRPFPIPNVISGI